jgi:hypothetical protein
VRSEGFSHNQQQKSSWIYNDISFPSSTLRKDAPKSSANLLRAINSTPSSRFMSPSRHARNPKGCPGVSERKRLTQELSGVYDMAWSDI